MKIKINLQPLMSINRTIKTVQSVDLVIRAQELSIAMLESQDDSEDMLDSSRNTLELAKSMLSFIQDFTQVSDEEMDIFKKKYSMEDVGKIVGYLIMRLQNLTDDQIKAAQKKQELENKVAKKDPKGKKN